MKPEDRWSPLLPGKADSSGRSYTVRAKVWRWKAEGGWHFVTLPRKTAAQIRKRFGATARGWGSIRVRVKIGDTQWNTSLFPERKARSYLFAIKASVRRDEGIEEGDQITARLEVV